MSNIYKTDSYPESEHLMRVRDEYYLAHPTEDRGMTRKEFLYRAKRSLDFARLEWGVKSEGYKEALTKYKSIINEDRNTPYAPTGLRKLFSKFTAVVGLIGGTFFLSSNVTGNVIGLSVQTSSWIGGVLILIGLVSLGFWINSRKNNNKVVVQKVSKSVKKK